MRRLWVVVILSGTGLAACGTPPPGPPAGETPEATADCESGAVPAGHPAGSPAATPAASALRAELLELRDADQAERTGAVAGNNDGARAARLREIIEEYGWPGISLVGADGASAAWLIAQHADFDVEFQRRALTLMCAAVAVGDADPVDVAYLVDRVAVNSGRPQVYGTQVAGCEDGQMRPQPIADPEMVDERRTGVGLEPLADYLAWFARDCAESER